MQLAAVATISATITAKSTPTIAITISVTIGSSSNSLATLITTKTMLLLSYYKLATGLGVNGPVCKFCGSQVRPS